MVESKPFNEASHVLNELSYALALLESDNAELRKLVDGWDFCSKTKRPAYDECVGCPLFEQSPHEYRCTRSERMEALAIEDALMSYDFKGKRVYLAGPMRGHDDLNFPAFDEAQRMVYDAGADFVFNPARAWGHTDKPASWYMLHDLHRLTESDGGHPLFDAIVMLDGWHASKGATLEYQVARACGIAKVNLREVGR